MPRAARAEKDVRQTDRLPMEPDESLLGYLMRAAADNLLSGPPQLLRLAGVRLASLEGLATKRRDLKKLAAFCNIPVESLVRASYRPAKARSCVNFLGHELRKEFVTLHHRRFCPECLREAPYHRAAWDLTLVTVCAHHRALLLTRCPGCGARPSWRTSGVLHCQCGEPLHECRPIRVPDGRTTGTAAIMACLGQGDRSQLELEDPLRFLEPFSAMSLLLNLGWFAGGNTRLPRPVKLAEDGERVAELLSEGYRYSLDWPSGFVRLCDELSQRRRQAIGRWGAYRSLAPIVNWMTERATPKQTRAVARFALARYLIAHPYLRSRSLKLKSVQPSGMLTLRQAAQRLHRGVVLVREVFKRHGLIAVDDGRGRGAPILIRRDSVEKIAAELTDAADKKVLRTILMVSRKALRYILTAGWLSPIVGAAAELCQRKVWSIESARKLLSLCENSVSKQSSKKFVISLPKAIMRLSTDSPWDVSQLAAELSRGAIRRDATGLSRYYLRSASVSSAGQKRELGLTVRQGARALGIKEEVAYFLLARGLIKARHKPGVRGRRLSAADLHTFKHTYLIPAHEGLDTGKSKGWATEQLIAAGIRPVSGPAVDGGRQYVFRRDAAEATLSKLRRQLLH